MAFHSLEVVQYRTELRFAWQGDAVFDDTITENGVSKGRVYTPTSAVIPLQQADYDVSHTYYLREFPFPPITPVLFTNLKVEQNALTLAFSWTGSASSSDTITENNAIVVGTETPTSAVYQLHSTDYGIYHDAYALRGFVFPPIKPAFFSNLNVVQQGSKLRFTWTGETLADTIRDIDGNVVTQADENVALYETEASYYNVSTIFYLRGFAFPSITPVLFSNLHVVQLQDATLRFSWTGMASDAHTITENNNVVVGLVQPSQADYQLQEADYDVTHTYYLHGFAFPPIRPVKTLVFTNLRVAQKAMFAELSWTGTVSTTDTITDGSGNVLLENNNLVGKTSVRYGIQPATFGTPTVFYLRGFAFPSITPVLFSNLRVLRQNATLQFTWTGSATAEHFIYDNSNNVIVRVLQPTSALYALQPGDYNRTLQYYLLGYEFGAINISAVSQTAVAKMTVAQLKTYVTAFNGLVDVYDTAEHIISAVGSGDLTTYQAKIKTLNVEDSASNISSRINSLHDVYTLLESFGIPDPIHSIVVTSGLIQLTVAELVRNVKLQPLLLAKSVNVRDVAANILAAFAAYPVLPSIVNALVVRDSASNLSATINALNDVCQQLFFAGRYNLIERVEVTDGMIPLTLLQLQRNSLVLPLLPDGSVSLQSLSSAEFSHLSELVASNPSLFYGNPFDYLSKTAMSSLVKSGNHTRIFTYLIDPSAETYSAMVNGLSTWDKPRVRNFALRVCNSDGFTVYGSDCGGNSYENVKDIPNNTRDSSGNYYIFQPMAEQNYVMVAFLNESGICFQTKYDRVANATVKAVAIRQGSVNEPIGVISLHGSF